MGPRGFRCAAAGWYRAPVVPAKDVDRRAPGSGRRAKAMLMLIAAAFGLAAAGSPVRGNAAERARVFAVVDGDTIRVDLRGSTTTVRLIGVDTPELGDRHDPTAPPQPFAR